MRLLRNKIDEWSQGIDERIRLANRQVLLEIYMDLPSPRFYIYLIMMREAIEDNPNVDLVPHINGALWGRYEDSISPEAAIAKG